MIELSKHIEYLLLEHNCVIVPQLGGFIAQDVPARYIPEENLFLPPHRTVGFNPQLTINDGLLVQSYMQAYDTNYPETIKLIENAVSALNSELLDKGEFSLNGIGKLTINIDGNYNFIPNEAGLLSPNLYGLDSIVLCKYDKECTKLQSVKKIEEIEPKEELQRNSNNYNFSINKELVNYVAAAVVAIFFYFIWATPVNDPSSLKAVQASMLFPKKIEHMGDNAIEVDTLETEIIAEAENRNISENIKQNKENNTDIVHNIKDEYVIVMISCIPQKNAERFVQELQKNGLEASHILKRRNIIRVVYGSYDSESTAYKELVELRKNSKYFHESWILHNKTN